MSEQYLPENLRMARDAEIRYYEKLARTEDEIQQLTIMLHELASHPPEIFPLSPIGLEAWKKYTASCREIEDRLRKLGVDL